MPPSVLHSWKDPCQSNWTAGGRQTKEKRPQLSFSPKNSAHWVACWTESDSDLLTSASKPGRRLACWGDSRRRWWKEQPFGPTREPSDRLARLLTKLTARPRLLGKEVKRAKTGERTAFRNWPLLGGAILNSECTVTVMVPWRDDDHRANREERGNSRKNIVMRTHQVNFTLF